MFCWNGILQFSQNLQLSGHMFIGKNIEANLSMF